MKRILLVVVTVLICLVTLGKLVTANPPKETQILYPSKDNTLIENPRGALSNGAGQTFFVGRTNQDENSRRRGIIAFDIASAIPAGAKVKSVKLTLDLQQSRSGNEAITLHRVLANWGEGTSTTRGGAGVAATQGDATWIHTFFDGEKWTNPGGDFVEKVSGIQTINAPGNYTWDSTSQMVNDVQEWLDSPESNFGWLLLGNEEASGSVKVFGSREVADTSAQPQLRVDYKLQN